MNIERIKNSVHKAKNKQIGNVRFDEKTYKVVTRVARGLGVTKQELILAVMRDFAYEVEQNFNKK